jgi:hypothetical protein
VLKVYREEFVEGEREEKLPSPYESIKILQEKRGPFNALYD